MNKTLKYFNRAQREAMLVNAHDEYIVAARGLGKSEGIDARVLLRNVWMMPGSTGAFLSPTYAKAFGNTLPAICHALKEWGYIEGVHYYVGKKAPDKVGFRMPKRPIIGRDAWGNSVHFWNGTVMVVLSFQNGMSANSMSLDWVIGPEAKFLDFEKIKSEVDPANRGNRQDFGDCPWHHAVSYSTDMPTNKRGKWILEKREEMDVNHINLIKMVEQERQYWAKDTSEAGQRKAKKLLNEVNFLRKYMLNKEGERRYTTFYAEYDVFENYEILGPDFIYQMKRNLPPLIFRTAFLNERLFRPQDGFYSALEESIHFYDPAHLHASVDVKELSQWWGKEIGCLGDVDCEQDVPLLIAFDSNSAISTMVVGQVHKQEMRTINSLFVKTPRKLQELVQDFCDYYRAKRNRDVVFYYDHTFTWTSGTSSESYADTIIRVLEKNKFAVTKKFIGQAMKHDLKHKEIDRALKGDPELLFPRFNLHKTEYLRLAMEQAGVKNGANGFQKDKSCEKLKDSPENPDETKTHITDAWDTLFAGVNFHGYEAASGWLYG